MANESKRRVRPRERSGVEVLPSRQLSRTIGRRNMEERWISVPKEALRFGLRLDVALGLVLGGGWPWVLP